MFSLNNLLRHASTINSLRNRTNHIFKRAVSQNSGRRRWGKDEILSLSTWLLVGTGAFVLVGTTTSASLALLLANSLQFQGKNSI